MYPRNALISAVVTVEPGVDESQACDVEDASGTAALRVSFLHAAAAAPDAQAGPP
jgi:hypothetical protein